MRAVILGFVILGAASIQAAEFQGSFDKDKANEPPAGWERGFLGKSGSPKWAIAKSDKAPSLPNVLIQTGYAANNWLIYQGLKIKNGRVTCQFKIDKGDEDPEAGIIWRFVDGQNHYYVRANTLENNVVVYRMHNGKKEMVKTVEVRVPKGEWTKLTVEFKNEDFTVFLGSTQIMSHKDGVIKEAGKVGLFTMADTVASFDNFTVSGE